MTVTEITIERTTGQDVFSTDQSDPSLTEEQAGIVAERYMELLIARLGEIYPSAAILTVAGNGLGGGTRAYADSDDEESDALATIQNVSQAIYESDDLWNVVA